MEIVRQNKPKKLSEQMKDRVIKNGNKIKETQEYDGNFGKVISTGSTLLDLAISGGRIRGGGLPGGILVEIFGPSGSGKTVLLSEIAGSVQKQKGEILFKDPEARLNKQFAKLFGLEIEEENYSVPNTITEVFKEVREWETKKDNKKVIHGVFADSLAALSTEMEMEKDEGDKMGMKRAKVFSEELRKTCRILTQKNYLMVCSNQIRVNVDGGPYSQKYISPGGEAIGFYSSLRLRTSKAEKIKEKRRVAGKEITRIVGVNTTVEVFKSSIWKPYRTAELTILFDYGIDDIRVNLQFIKNYTRNTVYSIENNRLSNSMEESIRMVECDNLENKLKEHTINLWGEIEEKFSSIRKSKL